MFFSLRLPTIPSCEDYLGYMFQDPDRSCEDDLDLFYDHM